MDHLGSYADFTYSAELLSVLCLLSSFGSYGIVNSICSVSYDSIVSSGSSSSSSVSNGCIVSNVRNCVSDINIVIWVQ